MHESFCDLPPFLAITGCCQLWSEVFMSWRVYQFIRLPASTTIFNSISIWAGGVPFATETFGLDSLGRQSLSGGLQWTLNLCWIVIHNRPCKHSSKLQLSIRFTLSRCLDVRQDWYLMYNPKGMKARVSPVQSVEPHTILAPTRNSNPEPPDQQSRVVTTILPLHTR